MALESFNKETIIRRLRGIVRRNNWSIQKLSNETGISVHQIRHLRYDYFSPTPEILRILEIFVRQYEEKVENIPPTYLSNPGKPIICSLRSPDYAVCERIAKQLLYTVGGIKLSIDFFIKNSFDDAKQLMAQLPDMSLFLDFNLYGSPQQIQSTIETLMPLKANFITLNTAGGQKMMRLARRMAERYAEEHGIARPKLLGTTVLPSLDAQDATEMGIKSISDHVLHLARIAEECGMDGVVCAGEDIARLRQELGSEMQLVASAIRPYNFETPKNEDQKRIFTATEAIKNGADHVIIGRPITDANNPLIAANQIVNRLAVTLGDDTPVSEQSSEQLAEMV